MSLMNSNKFIVLFSIYVANINRDLKNIKLDTMADFIQTDQRGLTITTNKVVFTLDLNTIKKYTKNDNVVDYEDVMVPQLSQSKSYIKILDILYIIENTNTPISSEIIEHLLTVSIM